MKQYGNWWSIRIYQEVQLNKKTQSNQHNKKHIEQYVTNFEEFKILNDKQWFLNCCVTALVWIVKTTHYFNINWEKKNKTNGCTPNKNMN